MGDAGTIDLTASPEEYANLFRFFYKNLIDDVKRPRKETARGFLPGSLDVVDKVLVEEPEQVRVLLRARCQVYRACVSHDVSPLVLLPAYSPPLRGVTAYRERTARPCRCP